ncbi:MAG: hypothetical protein ACI33P_14445 [Lysinibacillus sp.]
MQELIRKHHSLYMLDNEEQLARFIRLADEHKHIRDLLLLEGRDILLTRRVAFNIWQYLSNDDDRLIVDIEQRMIYPSTAFLLGILPTFNSVVNFKHNYGKEPVLLFVASIYLTNAIFYWYHEACSPQLQESVSMKHFLETDFYMLYEEQKNTIEGYPKEFAAIQAQELRILMSGVDRDKAIIKERIEDAIFEAKKIYNYLCYKGVYRKDEPSEGIFI